MSDDVSVAVNLTLQPDDAGVLRQVMIGLGRPTIVVEAVERDGVVELDVEGCGDQREVAAVLYMVAITLDPTLIEDEPAGSSA